MMRSVRILIGLVTVGYFAALAACGDGDGRKSGAAGLEDAFNDAVRAECACIGDQLGPAAEEMCLADLGELIGGLDADCIDEVVNSDADARQTLNCQVDATYDYAGCLRANNCDAGDQFECNDGTMLPESWECDEQADCQGGEDETDCSPHTCGDGSDVPESWVCDGEADCDDSSDEPGDCEYNCGERYFQRLDGCGDFSDEINNEVDERCDTGFDTDDIDTGTGFDTGPDDTGVDSTATDTAPTATATATATDTDTDTDTGG